MRISAPPIRHPCHYGIDMSTSEEMIAHGRIPAEGRGPSWGDDSLAYLSLAGIYEAIRGTRETALDACFSGQYSARRDAGPSARRVRERAALARA
jgi:amidophosphoribosyltransferase